MNCQGEGKISHIVSALNYIKRHSNEGDVINLSFGSRMRKSAKILDKAVESAARAGLFVAVAAGNSHEHAKDWSPARAKEKGVYTVCALTKSRQLASFSNYGSPPIDVCAPGENINSLSLRGEMAKKNGTSFATPHIAGLLAYGELNITSYIGAVDDLGIFSNYPVAMMG